MKTYIESLQRWLDSLQPRERQLVVSGSITLSIIMFYLLVWDPVFSKLETARENIEAQRQLLTWMQTSGQEIRNLQASGASLSPQLANQSVSSLVTMSAQSNGVQEFVTKLDSTKDGVELQLSNADFDRTMTWLNDLQTRYQIQPRKIIIEPQVDPGTVNVRITLEKQS
ncbi:MAG: type II secretion system protein M [Gammaproteobacteria bacterium]|jgi:general secretion pathway protein M|nr:type II secretion system protein M [Gammaproteobacteria bacterium]